MGHTQTKAGKVIHQLHQQQAAQRVRALHDFNIYAAPLITVVLLYMLARLARYGVRMIFDRAHIGGLQK